MVDQSVQRDCRCQSVEQRCGQQAARIRLATTASVREPLSGSLGCGCGCPIEGRSACSCCTARTRPSNRIPIERPALGASSLARALRTKPTRAAPTAKERAQLPSQLVDARSPWPRARLPKPESPTMVKSSRAARRPVLSAKTCRNGNARATLRRTRIARAATRIHQSGRSLLIRGLLRSSNERRRRFVGETFLRAREGKGKGKGTRERVSRSSGTLRRNLAVSEA